MRDPLCLGALLFLGLLVALAALTTRPKRCPSCKKRRARELKSRKIPGSDFERQRPGADYRTTETYRYTKVDGELRHIRQELRLYHDQTLLPRMSETGSVSSPKMHIREESSGAALLGQATRPLQHDGARVPCVGDSASSPPNRRWC